MNWLIKTAQAKLEEGQDTRDGSTIYYVSGNTYPIRTQLKSLGFRWYRAKGFWWMPAHRIQSAMRGLQNLGVDTSVINQTQSIPDTVQPNQPQPVAPQEVTESVIDSSPSDQPEAKIPFPIKNNIYSETLPVDILGHTIELTLQLNRKAVLGKNSDRYRQTYPLPWRKFPQYTVDVIFNDTAVSRLAIPFNREGTTKPINAKPYHMINEDIDILPLFKELKSKIPEILENPNSKLRRKLEMELNLSQRSPELTAYLQKLDDDRVPIKKNVYIDHSKHPGEYPLDLVPYNNGNSFHIQTALDHPTAPRSEFLTIVMLPETVKTVDEFNLWIDQMLQEPEVSERIQKKYADYLDSFAFSEEDAEAEKKQLQEIVYLIQDRSMDFEFYRRKLISLGYVRPHKRQKQYGPGMVPQDAIKWVIDTKKILADGFYTNNARFETSPDFFYALIAYHMHRFKAGTTDHVGAIQSNIMRFAHTLERYGFKISWRELSDYTETIARQLVEEITGERAPNTAWDNWQQFYGGDWSNTENTENTQPAANYSPDMRQFVSIAVGLGINAEEARNNPKLVYRQLSMKYHPDLNPDVDPSIMASINNAYQQVPHELKASSENWLQKVAGM